MPPRLTVKRAEPIEIKVLDEMSDGQWHPMSKITKNCVEKKVFSSNNIKETVADLTEQGYLIGGENNSYRMPSKYVAQWRRSRGLSMETKDSHSPRFFGGILEDDGWEKAPLEPFDLLNFRANSHISSQDIQSRLGSIGQVSRMEDGLFRVLSKEGDKVYGMLKDWDREEDKVDISGLRITQDTYRRDVTKLPEGFLEDLCRFYGKFSYVLLRNHMSSVKKHLPENDDVQQQIYIWILDAVDRYDDKKCIPFAAYLSTCLQLWVHNLSRKSHGRAAADTELSHLRAKAAFEAEHGRAPSLRELAEVLGDPLDKVIKDSASIKIVSNLRSTTTIDSDEFDIPLVSEDSAEGHVNSKLERTSISAALISAARDTSPTTKGMSVVAFMAFVDKNWHHDKRLAKIYRNKRLPDLQKNHQILLESFKEKIKDSHA